MAVGEDSRRTFSDFTVNGGRPGGTEILLDGAPNTSGAFNEIAVLPNADAVGEFQIITNAYSAEFGRAGTGVVQLLTKGGTNEHHGSLYDYFRNSALNANSFGNNAYGQKKGVFNMHQFGGSFSGPLPGARLQRPQPHLHLRLLRRRPLQTGRQQLPHRPHRTGAQRGLQPESGSAQRRAASGEHLQSLPGTST